LIPAQNLWRPQKDLKLTEIIMEINDLRKSNRGCAVCGVRQDETPD
jgi:hypothetical protein